jgi:hypothetical protein
MSERSDSPKVDREPFADAIEAQAEWEPVEGWEETMAQIRHEEARREKREARIDKVKELVFGRERSHPIG